jgi:putative SOS response-associated peptidase YedK
LLPIRQFDQRIGLTRSFADALDDPRDPYLTEHTFVEMVPSRVYGILAAYATLFRPTTGLFDFAGLWETWHGGDAGEPLDTFAILTTDANATVAPTHDRMPVIVEPTDYATWLDATKSADGSLLRQYPAEAMTATAVSTYVNNAQHQRPECIAAVGA